PPGLDLPRAAARVARSTRRRMPRIQMPAEHNYFAVFVGTGNLGDGVISRLAFRIPAIDYVELEFDRSSIGENARDAAVVLVAHHHGWERSGCVKGAVVESANLAMLTSGVDDPNQRPVGKKKLI